MLQTLREWIADPAIDARIHKTSRRVLQWRTDLSQFQATQLSANRQRTDQQRETKRISELLRHVPTGDGETLRTRYIKKLSQMEDTIERLELQERDLADKIEKIKQEL